MAPDACEIGGQALRYAAVLVKYHDRLTIDGFFALGAALRRGERRPLEEFVRLVERRSRRDGQIPLESDPGAACRFVGVGLPDLKPEGARLQSLIADLKHDAAKLEEFLSSEAHEELAFDTRPLVAGRFHLRDGADRLLCVREGATGRKYARTKAEVVGFLKDHPAADSVLTDLSLHFRLMHPVDSIEALERFIDEAPNDRVDAVIEAVELAKGFFFDPETFGAERASRKEWLLELNAGARTTLDFWAQPAAAPSVPQTLLSAAESELKSSLAEICAFAKRKDIASDASCFEDGLRVLEHGLEPLDDYWSAWDLDADRQRVLMAALVSDNFAGMASWNDIQIEKDAEYRRLSNRVVLCILQAICAAGG